jgi:hypothetical protein
MKRIFLCVILLIALATNVEAQTGERWYWAYREADGAVFAYQSSGNVRVLLEDVYAFKLHRLDDQTASVMIEMDGQFAAYILTPSQAMFVANLYTEKDLEGVKFDVTGPPGINSAKLLAPFILIWSYDEVPPLWNYRYMPLPLLLFNRETQQAELLPLEDSERDSSIGGVRR